MIRDLKSLRIFENTFMSKLPYVFIVPIDDKFNINAKGYPFNGDTIKGTGYHDQDVLFLKWLNNSYSRTVGDPKHTDFFFIPACIKIGWPDEDWWLELDKEILRFAENETNSFILDRSFMSATFALSTAGTFNNKNRNIHDVRKLRSDNDRSENSREIFVPYNMNFSYYDGLRQKSQIARTNFLFAPCRESAGMLEFHRWWRTKAFKVLQNAPNSIVNMKMSENEFESAMLSSTFCFSIPGDISSVQKMWRYIFSGCIPVVFVSFKGQLPFNSFIDWNSFSVILLKDVINDPKNLLRVINYLDKLKNNTQEVDKMRRNMADIAPLFNWERKNWPSVYHLTLLELKRTDSCPKHNLLNTTRVPYIC